MDTATLIAKLPSDIYQWCVRDISVFTTSAFIETYHHDLHEIVGFRYAFTLWLTRERNRTEIYFSESEHNHYHDFMADKGKDKDFCQKMANELRSYSDKVWAFMKEVSTLEEFKARQQEFAELYARFFTYHQAVYYTGQGLERKKLLPAHVIIMNDAYAYNEMVVPDVEDYLIRLGVDHLHINQQEGLVEDQLFLLLDGEVSVINGEELGEVATWLHEHALAKDASDVIEGLGINKGKVQGKVALVTNLNRLGDIPEGAILVTTQTRPQFNPQLKRCTALITDEGGSLCHAAILAREFGIPAVVGTRNATVSLKDGDKVEVDAEKGVVKRVL